jgi:signal peptidase
MAWVTGAVRVAAVLLLTVLAGLVTAALAPQALGLSAHVVVSGSMAPRVNVGDVVLTQAVSAAELRPGQVLLFTDPQRPGGLLLHRLVAFDAAGDLVTHGDANQSDDSVHVAPSAVRGLATMRVPWVGLPAQWRGEGRFGSIAVAAAALAGAAVFVSSGLSRRTGEPAGDGSRRSAGRHRSSAGLGSPMTEERPSAVRHVAAQRGATSTGEGRHRASSSGYVLPPVPPPAMRHPGVSRPGAAGPARPGLGPVVSHGDCVDGGRHRDQSRR